jgi:hypothetical protein
VTEASGALWGCDRRIRRRYRAEKPNYAPRRLLCMNRQQILAIILTLLMVGSSVAYGAALIF